MRNYEIMFIVRSTLSEDEIKNTTKNFEQILTSNGAKITDKTEMGQKEFAYEIDKMKSGYYFVYQIETENDKSVKEFDRLALISNDIVRHLITKVEE